MQEGKASASGYTKLGVRPSAGHGAIALQYLLPNIAGNVYSDRAIRQHNIGFSASV
jgi:hypothetical protein